MKCNLWSCAYHACLSAECQKKQVQQNGADWGEGLCEKIKRNSNTIVVDSISMDDPAILKRTIEINISNE